MSESENTFVCDTTGYLERRNERSNGSLVLKPYPTNTNAMQGAADSPETGGLCTQSRVRSTSKDRDRRPLKLDLKVCGNAAQPRDWSLEATRFLSRLSRADVRICEVRNGML